MKNFLYKGLSSEEFTIGNCHQDITVPESEIYGLVKGEGAEILIDEVENAGDFSIELDGTVLQVGK